MTFLYRFDVLQLDDVLTTASAPTSWAATGRARCLVHMNTNATEPQRFDAEPFSSTLIPPGIATAPAGGWVFLPEAITHNELRYDSEAQAGDLTVELPLMHQVASLFAEDTAGYKVFVTLAQLTPSGIKTLWTGRAIHASFSETRCTLTASHLLSVLRRPGLTRKHPRNCGHSLYDERTCGVKPSVLAGNGLYFAYREDGWLTAAAGGGTTLTVPAAANRPDGFFDNGFVIVEGWYDQPQQGLDTFIPRDDVGAKMPSPTSSVNGGYRHSIATHKGAELELLLPLPASLLLRAEPLRVTLFAGCDSLPATCKGRFNNYPRFGGYPLIPIENVFATGIKKPKVVS